MTVHKSYEISSFKARPDQGEGTFEAIVSVFGNIDLQGDRVMPGAFEKSIEKWKSSGDPIPVLWSHDWGDPYAHIGYVDPNDMREVRGKAGQVPGGLLVTGHLDVHKPFAKQVYDLLAERRVKEFSFSYDIPAGGEKRGKDGANELSTVDIIEIGPTLKGANPNTVSLGTKSDDDTETERRLKLRLDTAHDDELRLAIEKAGWDGAAAMQSCKNAADYRQIAFERANDSDPDTAAHWALPHHSSPGADANPAGVSAALGALSGARGGAPDLKNKAGAQSHLEAHQSASKAVEGKPWHVEKRGNEFCVIKDADNSEVACHPTEEEAMAQVRALYASEKSTEPDGDKAGRVIGAKAASALKDKLSSAIDSWVSDMNGGDGGDTAQEKALREAIEGAGVIHDYFGPDPELKEFNEIIAGLAIKK